MVLQSENKVLAHLWQNLSEVWNTSGFNEVPDEHKPEVSVAGFLALACDGRDDRVSGYAVLFAWSKADNADNWAACDWRESNWISNSLGFLHGLDGNWVIQEINKLVQESWISESHERIGDDVVNHLVVVFGNLEKMNWWLLDEDHNVVLLFIADWAHIDISADFFITEITEFESLDHIGSSDAIGFEFGTKCVNGVDRSETSCSHSDKMGDLLWPLWRVPVCHVSFVKLESCSFHQLDISGGECRLHGIHVESFWASRHVIHEAFLKCEELILEYQILHLSEHLVDNLREKIIKLGLKLCSSCDFPESFQELVSATPPDETTVGVVSPCG